MIVGTVGISACGGSSESGVSNVDRETISEAVDMSRDFIDEQAGFLKALGKSKYASAQIALDRMEKIMDSRSEKLTDIENRDLRQFFVGAAEFPIRTVQLYQQFLDAGKRGASGREIDRLSEEELAIANESLKYIRAEGQELLDLDETDLEEIKKELRSLQEEYFDSLASG